MRWISPLGWPEYLRPLIDPNPLGFLPIAAFASVCAIVAVLIAASRDLGAGAGPVRATTSSRTRLLSGQFGLTLRLTRPLLVGWLAALGICGLMFGVAAEAGGNAGADAIQRAVGRLGGEYGGAAAYLGVVFMVGAGLVAFAAAGQVGATRAEEADGYVDHLLVRPVARWRWLAGRAATSAGLVAAASVIGGLASWVGTASQHNTVPFHRLLLAGVNVAPPALFVLGAGLLVYGLRPRLASPVAHGLVAWSLLVQIVASGLDIGRWLRETSVLAHMAPAPAADPNWGAAAWLTTIGFVLAIGGIVAFSRRDLVAA
jgi:ABC-2 type transport system permease protein